MLVKPDWDVFKTNFSENPQANFEWLCYLLFCREFNIERGLFKFENHPALETNPIKYDKDYIGFQAKFYNTKLSNHISELKDAINEIKEKYKYLTKLYFYSNQDWAASKISDDLKTKKQKEVEETAEKLGIAVVWKTNGFFESEFVAFDNSNITQFFFDKRTNDYFEKTRKIQKLETQIEDGIIFPTSIFINDEKLPETGINILSYFIINQLKENNLSNFKDIFVMGIAGIGKSTEMKIAYNDLVRICSNEKCYQLFQFLPVPYFYELKDYRGGCFKINEKETPLLFLDGLDEIPTSELLPFIKELENLRRFNNSVRVIISGRDASFINEIKSKKHIDVRLSFYVDSELKSLLDKFRGTVFEPLVSIPFFRVFLSTQNLEEMKTFKDVIDAIVIKRIDDDIKRQERGDNSTKLFRKDLINIERIIDDLAQFTHSLFKNNVRTFTEKELEKSMSQTEDYSFIVKSSLFDYKDDKNISFISNIYFEYLLARYYAKQKSRIVKKDLFLSNGKVAVQHINIISILLNLLSKEDSLYKSITKKLSHESSAYVLLTDYSLLPAKERYCFYKRILKEYNKNNRHIYYGRFAPSQNILKNINSLSNSMQNLLPVEYYDSAVNYHVNIITEYLRDPTKDKLFYFVNSLILLSPHGKPWNEKNQELLKNISIPIVVFFLTNALANKVQGLLSEDFVLEWYEKYGWTKGWNLDDWNSFLQKIDISNSNFYTFCSNLEYKIKLKLYNHFYNNEYTKKLFVPLAIHILNNDKDNFSGCFVPSILDDEFKTPIVHSDIDIIIFTHKIKDNDLDISAILSVLKSLSKESLHYSLSYHSREIFKILMDKLKGQLPKAQKIDIKKIYDLIVSYIETESAIYLSDLDEYINLLNDSQKQQLIELLYIDLVRKKTWIDLWYINKTTVLLLDLTDKQKSIELFNLLKEKSIMHYRHCVGIIHKDNLNQYPLYNIAEKEYPKLFAEQIKIKQEQDARINAFLEKEKTMLDKEISIITNKEALLHEIENVFSYLDTGDSFSERKNEHEKLYDLRMECIENEVRYKERFREKPIFSKFVVNLLCGFFQRNMEIDLKAISEDIEYWFSDAKYFWRYFFWRFICNYRKEEVDLFLNDHSQVIDRIKKSMQQEVSVLIEDQDISMFDGGYNDEWVIPFVYYITKVYNNKLPDWFNKSKILNFVAYPAWHLSVGYSAHMNTEFKWNHRASVLEWIKGVSKIDEDIIIKAAIDILPVVKNDQSQAQIITIFVEKVKKDSIYKKQMLEAIVDKTRVEIKKDYKTHNEKSIMNSGVLSEFWMETNEDLIEMIYPNINFEKYNPRDINECRRSVMEYFCRKASLSQKKRTINSLKANINEPYIMAYLAKLGYNEAIKLMIDGFLKGDKWDTPLTLYSPMIGKAEESKQLLHKYCQLFEYSLEKESDRRHNLLDLAKRGIIDTTSKKNFHVLSCFINKIIKERKKNGLYYEMISDFLGEVEQKVF